MGDHLEALDELTTTRLECVDCGYVETEQEAPGEAVTCTECGGEIDWMAAEREWEYDFPRRFALVRHEDESGTSGTGVVAIGVEYPDGAVHMQWRNDQNPDLETRSNGVAFKPAPDGVEATEEIHGHDGRTEIVWIDEVGGRDR